MATGGLSHQVHGERCGFNNTAWDMQFLELLEKDPEQLAGMTHRRVRHARRCRGRRGHHVARHARRAVAQDAQAASELLPALHDRIATAIYEDDGSGAERRIAAYLAHLNHQLAGIEQLRARIPSRWSAASRAYRLNKFLHALIEPEWRAQFLRDPEPLFETAELTAEERDLVRALDWRGMIHYGVIFFMLEKLGAVVGVSNLHIYAAMRGETLEEFHKTRNAPGALYICCRCRVGARATLMGRRRETIRSPYARLSFDSVPL